MLCDPLFIHSLSSVKKIIITTVFHLSFLINLICVSGLSGALGISITENLYSLNLPSLIYFNDLALKLGLFSGLALGLAIILTPLKKASAKFFSSPPLNLPYLSCLSIRLILPPLVNLSTIK